MHFERNEVKLYIKVFNEWKLHNFLWDWEKGRGKQLLKIDGVVNGFSKGIKLACFFIRIQAIYFNYHSFSFIPLDN